MNLEEQTRELLYKAREHHTTELYEAFKNFVIENIYSLHGVGEYYFLLAGNVIQFKRQYYNHDVANLFEFNLPNHFSQHLLMEVFVDFLRRFELGIECTVGHNSASHKFTL